MTSPGNDPRPHREAARWLVRLLDSDLHDPRRAEFQRWIAADPAHACSYQEAEQLWRLSKEVAWDPEIMAASNRA
ncbi:MAG: FecR/PupR family sigma factor regulator, partial [Rhodanobacteraceae bacterium]